MAGYKNYSMSNNAISAYDSGKMPISKWTKTAILNAIEDYLASTDNEAYFHKFEKMTKTDLLKFISTSGEWHHTSKKYTKTYFYELSESMVDTFCKENLPADYVLYYPESGSYSSATLNEQNRYFTRNKNLARRVSEYEAVKYIKNCQEFNVFVEKVKV